MAASNGTENGMNYLYRNMLSDDDADDNESRRQGHQLRSNSDVDEGSKGHANFSAPTSTSSENSRVVVGIDFGTTFTGIAYARVNSDTVSLSSIHVLENWSTKQSNQQKVPSVISYSRPEHGEEQWGSDISEHAVTMHNTKLQLQPQSDRLTELHSALGVLQGTDNLSFGNVKRVGPRPAYPAKTPEQIIADYLSFVRLSCQKVVEPESLTVTNTPVDFVLTVPVNWSYAAKNSTFRAARAAGFNIQTWPTLEDVIVVTEPEAASYFTVKDLHASGMNVQLQVGDCFILCDAGGGTVDVVALQIKKRSPHLELEAVTSPTSRECGSTFVDTEFKTWLRGVLNLDSPEHYRQLDPSDTGQRISPYKFETPAMRELMKRFEVEKKRFSTTSTDVTIELPKPLNLLSIAGRVNEGELVIYRHEMKRMFDNCINAVLRLMSDQVEKLRPLGRRARMVLLVGGFGASPYLQKVLRDSMQLRNIQLFRPQDDKSWTAVVRGAVIYGIEKKRHKATTYMRAISRSHGIRVYEAFEWLIRKGDLIMSNESGSVTSKHFWVKALQPDGSKYEFVVYSYPRDHDDVPMSFDTGRKEVRKIAAEQCEFPRRRVLMHRSSGIGPARVEIILLGSALTARLWLEDHKVVQCERTVDTDR